MKRILLAPALFATSVTPTAACLPMYTDAEVAAHNHGYNTAALETLCGDVLVVSDPKLRAKLDCKFCESNKYRKFRRRRGLSCQGQSSEAPRALITIIPGSMLEAWESSNA